MAKPSAITKKKSQTSENPNISVNMFVIVMPRSFDTCFIRFNFLTTTFMKELEEMFARDDG